MAIHGVNPNTGGSQTEEMFNITNTTGRDLINNFSATIESLKSHWKGSDAVANLTDLANVYSAVTDLVKNLQKIIVTVNNSDSPADMRLQAGSAAEYASASRPPRDAQP